MRILQPGIEVEADPTWWHNRTARCAECQAAVELLPEDRHMLAINARSASTPCPTSRCDGRLVVYHPSRTVHEGQVRVKRQ